MSTITTSMRPIQPPKPAHLKLNRLVYTKYREMFGSYNDKANDLIQLLPTKKSVLNGTSRSKFL